MQGKINKGTRSITMEHILLLFFFALVFIISGASAVDKCGCPQGCRCFKDSSVVVCRNLKTFPKLCNGTKYVTIRESTLRKLTSKDHLPTSITRLLIQRCRVDSVQSEFFRNASNLTFLSFGQNSLRSVDALNVKSLKKLEQLDLSDNLLTKLGGLTSQLGLKILALNGNKIPHQEVSAALCEMNPTRLRTLRLEGMSLSAFPSGIVKCENKKKAYPELVFLSLSNNKITSLPRMTSSNLQTLYLSSNKIKDIADDSLPLSLRYLVMANNPLTQRSLQNIGRIVDLKHLDLAGIDFRHFPKTMFQKLTKLEFLSLNKCNITSLGKGQFSNLKNLKLISLNSNLLREFPSKGLAPMKSLEELYLDHNKMKYIRDSREARILVYSLKKLSVADNPYYCKCPLAWFCRWLRDPYRTTVVVNQEDTRCFKPHFDLPLRDFYPDCDNRNVGNLAIIFGAFTAMILLSFIICVFICCCCARRHNDDVDAMEKIAVKKARGYEAI